MNESADEIDDAGAGEEASFFLHGLSLHPDATGAEPGALPPSTESLRFLRQIGRGGMGVVYEAEDLEAGRRIAVKVVAPTLLVSRDALERFEREARTAAQISHDCCVYVYGATRVQGAPAIMMELMPGETLADRVARDGPVDVRLALRWMEDALDGLQAAHALGLVHRDVKPGNLFLAEDGGVKVGDFGLSKPRETSLSLTSSGTFLGSPLYASPEQVRGRPVDHRTDVWSAGATLYALLAGRPPFETTAIGDLFARIATEEPPALREIRPEVPRGLDEIVAKAMSKDPEARFASAAEMRAALAAFDPRAVSSASPILRAFAYVIDAVLIALVSNAFAIVAVLLAPGEDATLRVKGAPLLLVVSYFTLFEHLRGRTPGKALLGLRVLDAGGGRPSLGASLLRVVLFRAGAAVALLGEGFALAAAVVGLVPFVTMRRRNGWRGLHELLSRTRTANERRRIERLFREAPRLDPPRTDRADLPRSLGRYDVLARVARGASGEVLLGRDPRLDRTVWLSRPASVEAGPGRERGRHFLRWLDRGEGFDVLENPGGAAPEEYRLRGIAPDWQDLRGILLSALELARADALPEPEKLWIDRRGRLRLLDLHLGGAVREARSTGPARLAALVRSLTTDVRGTPTTDEHLPSGAGSLLERLRGGGEPFAGPAEAEAAILALGEPGERPRRAHRFAQAVSSVFLAALVSTLTLVAVLLILGLEADADIDDGVLAAKVFLAALTLGVFLPGLVLAARLRGGVSQTLFRMQVLDRRGERIAPKRAALRFLLAWGPATATCWALLLFASTGHGMMAETLALTVGALYLAAGIHAVFSPARTLVDLALGTHLRHVDEED